MFDPNGSAVGVPVTGVPGSVPIPDELADTATGFYLVVRGGGSGLPHVPASLYGKVSIVVVQDDFVDGSALSAFGEVFVHQQVQVSF